MASLRLLWHKIQIWIVRQILDEEWRRVTIRTVSREITRIKLVQAKDPDKIRQAAFDEAVEQLVQGLLQEGAFVWEHRLADQNHIEEIRVSIWVPKP